ncbi:MAG: CopG family transcriptional regulator [Candidatus Micrarchaeia archaeon]
MELKNGKNNIKEVKRKYTTITIPVSLYDKIQKIIEGTSFSSVSDYTTYVLRETIAEIEFSRNNKKKEKGKEENSEKENINNSIIKKFEALGYV